MDATCKVILAALIASLAGNVVVGTRWLRHKQAKAQIAAQLPSYGGPRRPDGRVPVPCNNAGTLAAVLLIMGQSNAANTLSAHSVGLAGVINFSVYDGACYEARDPLLGASNAGGNFATLLANQLVAGGHFDRVVLAPIAIGGTLIQQWMPMGEHNRRITVAIKRLREAGLEPTHGLWHQGEGNREDEPEAYKRAFRGVLSTVRRDGVRAPVLVAQATICGGSTSEAIRKAQRELADVSLGVLAGPDTDRIGLEFRYDACHFDGEGGRRVADLWLASIVRSREAQRLH